MLLGFMTDSFLNMISGTNECEVQLLLLLELLEVAGGEPNIRINHITYP